MVTLMKAEKLQIVTTKQVQRAQKYFPGKEQF